MLSAYLRQYGLRGCFYKRILGDKIQYLLVIIRGVFGMFLGVTWTMSRWFRVSPQPVWIVQILMYEIILHSSLDTF